MVMRGSSFPEPPGNIPRGKEIRPAPRAPLQEITVGHPVEANPMRAADGDGAAAGEVEGAGQFPAGGAQKRILISAMHFGDDRHAHDADDDHHHQQLDEGKAAAAASAILVAAHSYQFPISAPSLAFALSGSVAHKSGPVVWWVPGYLYW